MERKQTSFGGDTEQMCIYLIEQWNSEVIHMAKAFNKLMVKGLSTARIVVSDLVRGMDFYPVFSLW
jgi:hypothetical protein